MSDRLIRDIAVDVLCITTIWGLLNNPYVAMSDNPLNNMPLFTTVFGAGISIFVITKYY
jgi:hypothetical protein